MRKKLIMSLLMAIILAFVAIFVPVKTVRAEGNTCVIVETGVEYDTFANAKKAASSGQTIKLLQDIEVSSNVYAKKDYIIDFDDYTLTFTGSYFIYFESGDNHVITLKASGNGGISSSKSTIYFSDDVGEDAKVTIESGTYNRFNVYNPTTGNLNADGFGTAYSGKVIVNGGTFYTIDNVGRTNLKSFVSSERFKKEETLPSGSNRYKLDIKPYSYVSSENTKASAKISYAEGYSCYQKVTSLSSSDAGKQYILAYVNKTEDKIYIMKNYANASYHTMYPDKHDNVNKTNDGTWYINSNNEFLGDVDEDFFVELGWDSNGYTFTVNINDANPSNDQCLFYNKETGSRLEPLSDSYKSNDKYIYTFGFNTVDYYFYPIGANSLSIVYTPNLEYANLIRVASPSYESGLGDNHNVRLHLFEKVDIDPVVDSASLRFGDCITKEMYDYLSGCGTTVTFGVIAKLTSALGGEELEYANAQIRKEITPVRVSAAGATEEDLEGDFYQFALVLSGITSSNFDTSVTARCYVCIDGTYYYYFNPSVYSVKTLANAYYNADDTSSYEEHLPVLKYLKDYGD